MREPTHHDIVRLYDAHERLHGFSGMIGSIDQMYWAWAKCTNAWRDQYTRGDHGYPTIMFDAVATYDNWIWHADFGVAGSKNNIDVLYTSDLFNLMLNNEMSDVPYIVNGTIDVDPKRAYFSMKQADAGKDVGRTFGILQGRWHILQQPATACDAYDRRNKELHDRKPHEGLRHDLVEHLLSLQE
ncbi:uncharacterized protein [Rutidosis leptorrhynchoides]|uniref:uncharacterized protein n=1 Tax=Rutidosis leptorrhynchoides TaxID=125765 RepID=UPI003A997011